MIYIVYDIICIAKINVDFMDLVMVYLCFSAHDKVISG